MLNIHPSIEVNLHSNVLKADIKALIDNIIESSFKGNTRRLGESLHPSEIIAELMTINGVKSVTCTIEDLPSEVQSNEVLKIESYDLSLIGGV